MIRRKSIKKKIYYVYCLKRPDKRDPFDIESWQPFYIGYGKNGRMFDHRQEAKRTKRCRENTIKVKIIHKTWDSKADIFEEIIIDNLSKVDAQEIEMFYIALYGRINKNTGCLSNLTDGGEYNGDRVVTPETRERMRISHLKRWEGPEERLKAAKYGEDNPNYGNYWSEEKKQDMRERMTGPNHPSYGIKLTKEEYDKRCLDWTGRKHTEESKQKGRLWHLNPPEEYSKSLKDGQDRRRKREAFEACGHEDWIRCKYCKQYDEKDNMTHNGKRIGYHRKCRNLYSKKGKPNDYM